MNNELFPGLNRAMGEYMRQNISHYQGMTPAQRNEYDRQQFNTQEAANKAFAFASDPNKSKILDPFQREKMANAQFAAGNNATFDIIANMDKYLADANKRSRLDNGATASVTYTNPGTSSVNNPGMFPAGRRGTTTSGGAFQTTPVSSFTNKVKNRSMI